jgi:hypothetical protein
LLLLAGPARAATDIVAESFGGLTTQNLTGTNAGVFAPAMVSAGGSAAWSGSAQFKADGSVLGGSPGRSISIWDPTSTTPKGSLTAFSSLR